MPAGCRITVRCALPLVCLLAAHAASAQQADLPAPVFDKRPYGQAKPAAAAARKWLIVDASAQWCEPCQKMDKTTWRDQQVVAWLTDHAIAVELDVDANANLAAELRIEVLPTVIALKDGDQEFDRIVGYKSPSELLQWMEGITRGERAVDPLRKRLESRGPSEKIDVNARLDLARSLRDSGKAEEAAAEYAWLWSHMLEHDPAYVGVRLSFMKGDMEDLAAESQAAKKTFTGLRDEAEKAINKKDVALADLLDWIALNEIVGDKKPILAWFDRVKNDPSRKPILAQLSLMPLDLEDLLVENARWSDLGNLYGDPLQALNRAEQLRRMMSAGPLPNDIDDEERKTLEEMPQIMFCDKAGRLYAGLLAAGREKEAQAVADQARKLDESPRMVAALVSTALEAGRVRREHLEWLAAAAKTDPSLSGLSHRVQEALTKSGK